MRRRTFWALVAIALAAIVYLLFGGGDVRPRAGAAAASEPPAARAAPAAPRDPVPPRQPIRVTRAPSTPPLPPIIDRIDVEKPEVCRGEENLITVTAHTEGHGEDAWLHYMIVSDTGASVPLRLDTRDDERTRGVQRQIVVFGRDNVATTVMLPPYAVKDCDAERELFIAHRLMANTENEIELSAQVKDVTASQPMRPVRYRWTFGDGVTAETVEPFVVHDYGSRAEDDAYAQFVVACEAIGADGERVVGRGALQLANPAFEELAQKGLVRISTVMTPRFPHLDDRGRVAQQVRVWHHRPDAVTLTRIVVTRNFAADATGARPAPVTLEVTPESVLGTRAIGPGGLTAAVLLDTAADPTVSSLDYQLEGVSAEGYPAHGNFSLMRPPPAPTRDNSHPVVSEYLKAKILRARDYLHQDTVTDEDLWRLERLGVFHDLRPEDFPPPGPEPEPVRPPPGLPPRPAGPGGSAGAPRSR